MTFEDSKRRKRDKQDRLLDERVARITSDIRNHIFRQLRSSEAEINRATSPDEIVSVIANTRVKISNADIEGFIAEYTSQYRQKVDAVRDSFEDIRRNPSFNEQDLDITRTMISFDVERIRQRIETYLADINASIVNTRLQGALVRTSNIEDNIGDKIVNNLNTEVTTNLDAFERTETVIQGQKMGLNLFLYVGGLIKTSRDFCRERDGKVFSWDEIKTWDNGQLAPASVYLGGYNCRHHLAPVTDEIARDEFGYR